jgi:16S rRNA G1207 methylase RsmC
MTHYFDSYPKSESQRTNFTIRVRDDLLTLASETGVFSARGLDKGTAVLLEWALKQQLPQLPAGSLLCDLGCGSGAIALTMATLYPHCTVHAVDVNARARQLCLDNATRNNITNVVAIDPIQRNPDNRYALLWSNPPIRIGKTELHDLLLTWLPHLDENAHGHLVVSKNLGADSLINWLNAQGLPAVKLASSKGFRVIEASRSKDEKN